MKFGINPAQAPHRRTLKQAILAKKVGLDSIWFFERHLDPHYSPNPILSLAWLLEPIRGMRLGADVLLLPLHHPAQVAEEVAYLDRLSGGRLILGLGLGYRREEFDLYGISYAERAFRMEEALQILKRLLAGEEIAFEGRYYRVKGRVEPRPLRRPELWMGGWGRAALRRAAKYGDAWLPGPTASLVEVRERLRLYHSYLKELDRAAPRERPIVRELYLAKSSEEAWKEARPLLLRTYSDYLKMRHPIVKGWAEFEELAQDRFVIGSPAECIEAIERYRRELGIDTMIFRVYYPGMKPKKDLETIELLGREVLPYYRDR